MAAADQREHKPPCIYDMMERLGIEVVGAISPRLSPTYASAFHRCEQCQTPDACRKWLKTAPQTLNFAPKFCPNADIFVELQCDQPGGRAAGGRRAP